MRNTEKWKKLITLASIASLSIAAFISPATTIVVEAATEEGDISPCADIIGWRFKEENGNVYRRLYNYSTASWIGDWEYLGPA